MGLPTPQFVQDAFFKVVIYRKLKASEGNNDNFEQSNNDVSLNNDIIKGVNGSFDKDKKIRQSNKEILNRIGLTRQTKNIKTYITDLVEKGFLKMIDPEHPRSKNQKYIKA